jgi:hypothetical protein
MDDCSLLSELELEPELEEAGLYLYTLHFTPCHSDQRQGLTAKP